MKKNILILQGDRVDTASRILKDISDRKRGPNNITTKTLRQFTDDGYRLEEGARYDQIIIHAHGTYAEESNPDPQVQRQNHSIFVADGYPLLNTGSLVECCAKYSDKIFIESCFAGVVIRDIADIPNFLAVDVVAVGGSKHATMPNPAVIDLEREFLYEGASNLEQFVANNYPGTVGIRWANGDISKISTVKLQEDGVTLMRHRSRPNPDFRDSAKWWSREPDTVVEVGADNRQFKNVALSIALSRGKMDEVHYWQRSGADVNAPIYGFGHSLLYSAALDGDAKKMQRLFEIDGLDFELTPKVKSPLFIAATRKHEEVTSLLLSRLTSDQLKEHCEFIKNKFGGVEGARMAEFLLPKILEVKNEDAVEVLLSCLDCKSAQSALVATLEKDLQQAGEFLLPKVAAKFDEDSKAKNTHVEKAEFRKQKELFDKAVDGFQKKNWSVPQEVLDLKSASSLCMVS